MFFTPTILFVKGEINVLSYFVDADTVYGSYMIEDLLRSQKLESTQIWF